MKPSGSRSIPFGPVFGVGLLVVVAVGAGVVPQPAAAGDQWANTCLDAGPLESGTYFGSFGESERDVFLFDLADGERASVDVSYSVSGSTRMVVFGVNQLIMERDVGGSMGYFEVDESSHPKYYYRHSRDVSISLDGGAEIQYRKNDAGDTLNARHLVRGYSLSEGVYEFTVEPKADVPICLVMQADRTEGGGSWILDYSVEGSDANSSVEGTDTPVGDDQRIRMLQKTVTAQKTRIDELERAINGSGNASQTRTVVRTKPVVKTVTVTRSAGSSGVLGMDIPILWVIGLLAFGVLLARKL